MPEGGMLNIIAENPANKHEQTNYNMYLCFVLSFQSQLNMIIHLHNKCFVLNWKFYNVVLSSAKHRRKTDWCATPRHFHEIWYVSKLLCFQ